MRDDASLDIKEPLFTGIEVPDEVKLQGVQSDGLRGDAVVHRAIKGPREWGVVFSII